ncbi:hypothetical protein [Oceanobacillus sp. FSL K6-0251]|uniref:hypothetical protein n=1 Tax=Oceanobacillus sp. FSL K6-0251 TaxID=2921602 RepID=UPI0030F79063
MDLKKTKIQNFSLGNVEWGSQEFYEIHERMKKQEEEIKEYKKAVKAIKIIQGDYV